MKAMIFFLIFIIQGLLVYDLVLSILLLGINKFKNSISAWKRFARKYGRLVTRALCSTAKHMQLVWRWFTIECGRSTREVTVRTIYKRSTNRQDAQGLPKIPPRKDAGAKSWLHRDSVAVDVIMTCDICSKRDLWMAWDSLT